jgi:hypothetical protein
VTTAHRLSLLLACLWAAPPSTAFAADRDPDADTHTGAPADITVELLPAQRGLQLGARIGYALPAGALSDDSALNTSMSHLETASVPIGIDAGSRLSPRVYLGGTVAWGPGFAPNTPGTCPASVSCFRQDAQLRAEVRYYFAPERKVAWWGSLGAGWELAAFSQSAQGSGVTSTLTGPLGDLEVGFDARRGARAIGPYVGLSLGSS